MEPDALSYGRPAAVGLYCLCSSAGSTYLNLGTLALNRKLLYQMDPGVVCGTISFS